MSLNKIISDYRKEFWTLPLRWWIVTVIELAVYIFTGIIFSSGISRVFAIVSTVLFIIVSTYATISVLLIVPMRFEKRLNVLPENERNGVLEQYGKAPALGKRHFLDEYLIYYLGAEIILQKFSDIRSAELKGFKLLLDIGERKPLKMPFEADENPALLVAAMRSRNPNISVILNGKVVEKMENGKEKSQS